MVEEGRVGCERGCWCKVGGGGGGDGGEGGDGRGGIENAETVLLRVESEKERKRALGSQS